MEAVCRSRAGCAVVKTQGQEEQSGEEAGCGPKEVRIFTRTTGAKDTAETVSQECNQDEVFQMIEANGEFQKMIMEGSVAEVEERIRNYLAAFQNWVGWDEELMEEFGERIRGVVEEKRREETRSR